MSGSVEIRETSIADCYLLLPRMRCDHRGAFIKTFQTSEFEVLGLTTQFKESYYSVSWQDVLRGMHFQRPPDAHVKLVYCPSGVILDVVVDLRHQSSTFGVHESFELSAENGALVYIPVGLAHGFWVKSKMAITVYHVTTEYSPSSDAGIRWDSCGINWPGSSPIISERDASFPPLDLTGKIF